jgi:hypothetical protein
MWFYSINEMIEYNCSPNVRIVFLRCCNLDWNRMAMIPRGEAIGDKGKKCIIKREKGYFEDRNRTYLAYIGYYIVPSTTFSNHTRSIWFPGVPDFLTS